MAVDARTWIDCYARALGTETLGEDERDALLELAAIAAHSSERTAAPLSCWIAARAGLTPAQALVSAQRVADTLGTAGGS